MSRKTTAVGIGICSVLAQYVLLDANHLPLRQAGRVRTRGPLPEIECVAVLRQIMVMGLPAVLIMVTMIVAAMIVALLMLDTAESLPRTGKAGRAPCFTASADGAHGYFLCQRL